MTKRFLRGAIMAAGVCLPLFCLPGAPRAQDASSPMQFWLQEESRTERHARPSASSRQPTRVRRLVPNAKLARPTIWRTERVHESPAPGAEPRHVQPADATPGQPAPATQPTPDTQKADLASPAAAVPSPVPAAPPASSVSLGGLMVAVVGDNLGYWLGQGLADGQNDPATTTRLGIVRKTKDSSGLVRDDFFDWQKSLREILNGPDKFGAVAIMIGSNDRQELRDGAGRYEPLSPRWRELYAARVDAFLAQIKERGLPIFWVGMPIMRAERYSSEIGQLNDIDRARVEAAGGRYVDIWDAFADESGRFSVFGPDVNGQTVKLRTSDGIHFTKAGARKLAWFFEQAIRPLIERPKTQPDAAIAALPPAGAPAPAAPVAPSAAIMPLAPSPPPPRPLAGPILPLTAPALSPGGELVGASPARTAVVRDLAEGRLPPAQPGRADDFSWPRR